MKVEFPLGEVVTLAPLIAVGIIPKPELDPKGITGKERWKAQGLESKAFIEVEEYVANMILKKLGKYRCSIKKGIIR